MRRTREPAFDFLFDGPIGCFLLVIGFIAFVAFLASVDRVVKRVEPENRRMDPGQVWLCLIPGFNLLWIVVMIERVGESIRNEFIARGRHKLSESYGKTAGLAFVFLSWVGIPFAIETTPCVLVFWFFAFIYWVVYWTQISNYARKLNTESGTYSPPPDEGW
jgi:hypothetical protein